MLFTWLDKPEVKIAALKHARLHLTKYNAVSLMPHSF